MENPISQMNPWGGVKVTVFTNNYQDPEEVGVDSTIGGHVVTR